MMAAHAAWRASTLIASILVLTRGDKIDDDMQHPRELEQAEHHEYLAKEAHPQRHIHEGDLLTHRDLWKEGDSPADRATQA